MSILILTHSQDNAASQSVIDAIHALGGQAIRLDTDYYPTKVQISSEFDGKAWHKTLRCGDDQLALSEITAIWYRRWLTGKTLPESLQDRRQHCIAESARTLYGTIAALDVFTMDRWIDVRLADFKEVQTRRAAELGLTVPATLFSNDPQIVRRFYQKAPQGIVTKMQTSFAIYEDNSEKVVFTSEVTDAHLKELDGLRFAPMLFQHKVDKVADIRVTVVGTQIFSAILQREDSHAVGIDWRAKGNTLVDQWRPYQLPDEIAQPLVRLVRSFGLHYAACDFVLDAQGAHQFLEINACGEWLWIAEATGQPIAAAIAQTLLSHVHGTACEPAL